jgi:tight adherence protein C
MDPMITTVALFAAVAIVLLSGYYALTAKAPATRRIEEIVGGEGAAAPSTRPASSGPGSVKRGLMALAPYGVGGGDASLTKTLSFAGFRGPNATMLFVGARTLISLGPAMFVLVTGLASGRPFTAVLFRASLVWGVVHVLVSRQLKARATRRIASITRGMPDALDLMVVCLEAGLGLNATIARVGEERANMRDALGEEFAQVSEEMRGGRSREEALRALGARNGCDDLKALAALIIQSDRLGASMAQTLRSHADLLRTKRRQRAEEAARKLPIKMLFPLALFILPALFVVVGGPAALIFRDFVKVMGQR